MTYLQSKLDIVKVIVDQLTDDPDNPCKNVSADKLVFDWFLTGRSGNGLRLTESGKAAFEYANITHYDFNFTPDKAIINGSSWGRFTLILDRKVKCPYYIGTKLIDNRKKETYIRLYDHRIAIMMTLYGDLQSYIESVK